MHGCGECVAKVEFRQVIIKTMFTIEQQACVGNNGGVHEVVIILDVINGSAAEEEFFDGMIKLKGGVEDGGVGWNDFSAAILHLFNEEGVLLFLKFLEDKIVKADVFCKHFGFNNIGGGGVTPIIVDDLDKVTEFKVDTDILIVHAEKGERRAVAFSEPKVEWYNEVDRLLCIEFIGRGQIGFENHGAFARIFRIGSGIIEFMEDIKALRVQVVDDDTIDFEFNWFGEDGVAEGVGPA